ncbi:uncharacterized protein TM35_000471040 [Trypanosoma theileri]|uniref:Mucin TcMUCII n=1 Tax=Trypanosoma theileri TaxID=67003 RepID=A0A1X0NJ47_9TRYP|nr:uncharacterized protein TM35_000471040 [Trypanosoma theileri]ORC84209.1 hypothetical protein TM35_000471040 [Trypanosoma theileri]
MMLMRPDFCLLVFLLIVASVCVSANTTSSPEGDILTPRSRGGVPVPKEQSGTLRIEVIDPPEDDVPNPPRVDGAGGDRDAVVVSRQEQQLVRTSKEYRPQEESTEGGMKTDKANTDDAPEKLTPTVDAQPTPTQITDPKSKEQQGEMNPTLPQEQKPNESQDPQERDIPSDPNSLSNTNTVPKETADSGASSTTPSPQTSADTTASDGTPGNSSQEDIKNVEANGTESPETTTNTSESINTDTPNTTNNNEESPTTPSPVANAEITTIASAVQTNKPIADSSISPVWMRTAVPLLIVAVVVFVTMY